MKQILNTLLNTLVSGTVRKISTRIIKLYRSCSSIFQTNLPDFSKTLEPCLNIWDFALLNKYYQINKKMSPCKSNFILTT